MTGISAALHLKLLGYKNVLLIGPERAADQCASVCPGFVTAGTIDNITRIAHGHGIELATALLDLGISGYKGLRDFALGTNLSWISGDLKRFAPTDHEKNEMKFAIETLQKMGFQATLRDPVFKKDPKKVVGIQADGLPSATTPALPLLDQLERHADVSNLTAHVRNITTKSSSAIIETETETVESEMVIAATHLGTGAFIPNLQTALVSFADQWISFESKESAVPLNAGDLWIGHYGHYAVWKNHQNKVFMTGARFLRHWAGIEATAAEVKEDITQHLIAKGIEWFGFKKICGVEAGAILDCRPCDELPVIGPMFGQDRILVGTGYMGAGLALGFATGKVLADIIHSGRSKDLHPGLTPARLRTLST